MKEPSQLTQHLETFVNITRSPAQQVLFLSSYPLINLLFTVSSCFLCKSAKFVEIDLTYRTLSCTISCLIFFS